MYSNTIDSTIDLDKSFAANPQNAQLARYIETLLWVEIVHKVNIQGT